MRAFLLLAAVAVYAETAEEIMAKAAANRERAAAGRQQFGYSQTVRSRFILKTAVHRRQPRLAPMFTSPRAVVRNHPLGELRSSCAAQ